MIAAILLRDGTRIDRDRFEDLPAEALFVSRVICQDEDGREFESWGKTWSIWDEEEGRHRIVRVGAGAYGDSYVWRHPRFDGLRCRIVKPGEKTRAEEIMEGRTR